MCPLLTPQDPQTDDPDDLFQRFENAATHVAVQFHRRAIGLRAVKRWRARTVLLDKQRIKADAWFFWNEARRAWRILYVQSHSLRRLLHFQKFHAFTRFRASVALQHVTDVEQMRQLQALHEASSIGACVRLLRAFLWLHHIASLRRVGIDHQSKNQFRRCMQILRQAWSAWRCRGHELMSLRQRLSTYEGQAIQVWRSHALERSIRCWRKLFCWRHYCGQLSTILLQSTIMRWRHRTAAAVSLDVAIDLGKRTGRRTCLLQKLHAWKLYLRDVEWTTTSRAMANTSYTTLYYRRFWTGLIIQHAKALTNGTLSLQLRLALRRWRHRYTQGTRRLLQLQSKDVAASSALVYLHIRRCWNSWTEKWKSGYHRADRMAVSREFRKLVASSRKVASQNAVLRASSESSRHRQLARALVAFDFAAATARAAQPFEDYAHVAALESDARALASAMSRLRSYSSERRVTQSHRLRHLLVILRRWSRSAATAVLANQKRVEVETKSHLSYLLRGWGAWQRALAAALIRSLKRALPQLMVIEYRASIKLRVLRWQRWLGQRRQQHLRIACAAAAANSLALYRGLAHMQHAATTWRKRLILSIRRDPDKCFRYAVTKWRDRANYLAALSAAMSSWDRRLVSAAFLFWARVWWLRSVPFVLGMQNKCRILLKRWWKKSAGLYDIEQVLLEAALAWNIAASKLLGFNNFRRNRIARWLKRAAEVRQRKLRSAADLATALEVWDTYRRETHAVQTRARRQLHRLGFARFRRVRGRELARQKLSLVARSWLLRLVWSKWHGYCSLRERYDRLLQPLRHRSCTALADTENAHTRHRWNSSTHIDGLSFSLFSPCSTQLQSTTSTAIRYR